MIVVVALADVDVDISATARSWAATTQLYRRDLVVGGQRRGEMRVKKESLTASRETASVVDVILRLAPFAPRDDTPVFRGRTVNAAFWYCARQGLH